MDTDSNEAYIDLLDDPCTEVGIGIVEGVMRESGFSSYAAYVIKITKPITLTVERRYRQFFALREAMVQRWPGVFIPFLPPKHISGNSDLKIVNERVKYLSYFLNCIAKVNYLFMSDQFQLFLHSNSSDLKKTFEKMEKLSFQKILSKYQVVFSSIAPNLQLKANLMNRIKDEALPFAKELQNMETKLVNIKKDLNKLAAKRENYLKHLGNLYSDALPQFQQYLGTTYQSSTMILENDPVLKEKIAAAKTSKAQNYWVLYEAVRLQIGETRAVLEVIQRRADLEREEERIRSKILSNEEQLSNIKNKKSSLRQFFTRNTDELTRQLQHESEFLRRELVAVELVMIYVSELILRHVIWEFKEKRMSVWRRAFKHMIVGEQELNMIFGEFFKVIAMN